MNSFLLVASQWEFRSWKANYRDCDNNIQSTCFIEADHAPLLLHLFYTWSNSESSWGFFFYPRLSIDVRICLNIVYTRSSFKLYYSASCGRSGHFPLPFFSLGFPVPARDSEVHYIRAVQRGGRRMDMPGLYVPATGRSYSGLTRCKSEWDRKKQQKRDV